MPVLVIAEHENHNFKPEFYKVLAAATQLFPDVASADVHVFVTGKDCQPLLDTAADMAPVTKVINLDAFAHPFESLQTVGEVLHGIADQYSHVLCATTPLSKTILPVLAVLLDVDQISNVAQIESSDTFVRPIYAGRLFNRVQSGDAIKLMSIVPSAFDALTNAELEGGNRAEISAIGAQMPESSKLTEIVSIKKTESERPPLQSAKVVVSVGRGMVKKPEDVQSVETFADSLGAAIGATRAVVDAGYMPNDKQVGQTAKIVSPDLYIALGISGAAQHLAGMKSSKIIIAVNKDENAPIFSVAHFGLIGDLKDIMPQLNDEFG